LFILYFIFFFFLVFFFEPSPHQTGFEKLEERREYFRKKTNKTKNIKKKTKKKNINIYIYNGNIKKHKRKQTSFFAWLFENNLSCNLSCKCVSGSRTANGNASYAERDTFIASLPR